MSIVYKCIAEPLTKADDVEWDHNSIRIAMNTAEAQLDNQRFGFITSMSFEQKVDVPKNVHILIAVKKKYGNEEEARQAGKKFFPPEVLVEVPEVGVVTIPIIVIEHGPYKIFANMVNGSRVQTEGYPRKGVISHLKYGTVARGVSAAHVLTKLDGTSRDLDELDFSAEYTVSGQVPAVLYAANHEFADDEIPKRNLYDFAWCDLPADVSYDCFKVNDDTMERFLSSTRDIFVQDEPVALWNQFLGKITAKVVSVDSKRCFDLGSHIMFMDTGFEIDLGENVGLVGEGECGTLVWSTRDYKVLGMIGGQGHEPSRVYINRVPDERMLSYFESIQ